MAQPARRFTSYKGQRNLPGRWWSAADGQHVGYESWLERDRLMLLDFDPAVVAIASQPFWLSWVTEERKRRSHVPDYFARKANGSGVVIDCRPAERRKPRDMAAFEATRNACAMAEWEYRNAPVIETYYPQPGPTPRQRGRFAAEAAEFVQRTSGETPGSTDRVGVLSDRRLNSGRRCLILPDGQQRTVAGEATDDELTARYGLDQISRMPMSD